MVLDVLFYGDTDNPKGIDSSWPAKVREVADDGAPAPDPPWVRMTVQEYKTYRSANVHKVAEITERKQQAIEDQNAHRSRVAELARHAAANTITPAEQNELLARLVLTVDEYEGAKKII